MKRIFIVMAFISFAVFIKAQENLDTLFIENFEENFNNAVKYFSEGNIEKAEKNFQIALSNKTR